MKSGVCPKCGSDAVYTNQGSPKKRIGDTGHILLVTHSYSKGGNIAPFDDYVCAECGYTESYISDASKLDDIRDLWLRVNDLKRKNDDLKRKNDET